VHLNPFEYAFHEDPYPIYTELRAKAPVYRNEELDFWALSRHADVLEAFRDPETYSNRYGVSLEQNQVDDAASVMSFLAMDPPQHGRLRLLVSRGFTPRRVSELEPRIREIANQCLDKAIKDGELELVRGFSIPLPVTVIAEMLGVESDRVDQFKSWSDAFILGLSGASGQYTPEDVRKAADEMADYFEQVAAERRASPKDDLISVLSQAEEGDALSTGELLSFVALLLIAGNETTTNLIGSAMGQLTGHPDQLAEVAADLSLVPGMLEEAVRHQSPIQGIPRKVMQEVELAGTIVPKDAMLMVMFASANRDEKHFPDPDRFDIHRNPQRILTFGHADHRCLGNHMALMEGRVLLEEVLRRFPEYAIIQQEVVRPPTEFVQGYSHFPILFRG